jgi:hypothetical protein
MARYFFNIRYGERLFDDDEGSEHDAHEQAWEEATKASGEMLRDLDGRLRDGQEWRMEVTNEASAVVFVIRINAEKGPGYTPV